MMENLETPLPVPLTVGSTPSGSITSSSPAIVSIDSAGNLIGHQNGRAEIRSPNDRLPLLIEVRAVSTLTVEPALVSLRPGEVRRVRVSADGTELPPAAIRWAFSESEVAMAEGASVRGGFKVGSARLTASYGSLEASLTVEVGPAATAFAIVSRNRRLAVGALEQLQANVPAGAQVSWTSSDGKVLKPLSGGIFYAQGPGTAKACGQAMGRQSCVALEVR